ncbi:hypothetical protein MKW92_041833 [Papaver armeniacum]|nr:hypothetical protein MKW92_041833 [Papaver armeniacum]
METLMSSSSSLHFQSSKNRSFPLLSTSNKPEFVSFFPASSHQKRSNHNNLSQAISLSRFKAIMGSVISRSCSSKSSFYPQDNAAETEFLSQETLQSKKTVKVRFQLIQECSYGQEFLVVGDDPILGAWDPSSAIPLKWSEGNIWNAELDVPIDKRIEFKFVLKDPNTGEVIWHPRPNRVFQTWETKMIVVYEDWDIVFGDWHILFEDWDKVGFLKTWVGLPNSNEKKLVVVQPLGSSPHSSADVSSIRLDDLFESLTFDLYNMDELQ